MPWGAVSFFRPKKLQTHDTLEWDVKPRRHMMLWRHGVMLWRHNIMQHTMSWQRESTKVNESECLKITFVNLATLTYLTFGLIRDTIKANPCINFKVRRSNGSARRLLRDRHTDGTDFIPSTADVGENNSYYIGKYSITVRKRNYLTKMLRTWRYFYDAKNTIVSCLKRLL